MDEISFLLHHLFFKSKVLLSVLLLRGCTLCTDVINLMYTVVHNISVLLFADKHTD